MVAQHSILDLTYPSSSQLMLVYRPLENPDPGMTLVDRFICFVKQCLDGVDTK